MVLEALRAGQSLSAIYVDERARPTDKLDELLTLAGRRGVSILRIPRERLDAISVTGGHNGVIAEGCPLALVSLEDALRARRVAPLWLGFGPDVEPDDLGAVLRTAAAVGVETVILPPGGGALLPASARRIAMGAAEQIRFVRAPLSEGCEAARRAGFGTVAVGWGEGSQSLHEPSLDGPRLLVFTGLRGGPPGEIERHCDHVVALHPVRPGATLPLSALVAVALYERERQAGRRS